MVYLIRAVVSCAFAALLTLGCSASPGQTKSQRPIVFAPGLGMSTLHVNVEPEGISFDFLVPVMNPDILSLEFSIGSGLPRGSSVKVAQWLSLEIDNKNGDARNWHGVQVAPVSFGENFAEECPRYLGMVEELASHGWQVDDTLMCAPYDYRYPPGENTFATDLRSRVTKLFKRKQQKIVLACHSQGCLMTLHALRTLDQKWVIKHVHSLFSFAGQFSGCSDCTSWAFSPGWNWEPDESFASPVDPTWVGQMALDLQHSVYGDAVLYRVGTTTYSAADTIRLLTNQGAIAMARATGRYSLSSQPWFQSGDTFGEPLPVPTRFVFGTGLPTVIGYNISPSGEMFPITADGDGGDSSLMNRSPMRWSPNSSCDIKELPGIDHMEIFTNLEAINLLFRIASQKTNEIACVGP